MKSKKIFIFICLIALSYFSFCDDFNIDGEKYTKNIYKMNNGEVRVAYCYNIPKKKVDELWNADGETFYVGFYFGALNKKWLSMSIPNWQGYYFISRMVPSLQKLMLEYNVIAIEGEDGRGNRDIELYVIRNVKDGDGEVLNIYGGNPDEKIW